MEIMQRKLTKNLIADESLISAGFRTIRKTRYISIIHLKNSTNVIDLVSAPGM